MNKKTQYQLLKNLQHSLLSISKELAQVRLVSQRDDAMISTNLGRLEGLAQGLDFFIETLNPDGELSTSPTFGFSLLGSNPENVQEEPEHEED